MGVPGTDGLDMDNISALAILSVLLGLVPYSQAQLQCATLNLNNPLQSPAVGSYLPVCSNDNVQCCTSQYIDDVTQHVRQFLIGGVREEFQIRIDSYNALVQQLMQYFAGNFSNAFRTHLPLTTLFLDVQLRSAVSGLIQTFVDNIMITDQVNSYNISVLVRNITDHIVDLAVDTFAPAGTMSQRVCINNFIQQQMNQTALSQLDDDLKQIRKGFTATVQILGFLQNYVISLGNFQPLQHCEQSLVELSFCPRCTHHIPPLCSNTCGALIQACYSPFVDGLKGEFDNLWNVSRQVIRAMNHTLTQIFSEENHLIKFSLITDVALLTQTCGTIMVPSFRQDGNLYPRRLLPASIIDSLNQFRGVFEYGNVPAVCKPVLEYLTCNYNNSMCGREQVCTAACNCWDGTMNRTRNTEQFSNYNIKGQNNNPVIQLNQQELIAQAKSLGIPVSTFLFNTNFTEISPEGVTVPPARPYGSSGAVTLLSLKLIFTAVILSTSQLIM